MALRFWQATVIETGSLSEEKLGFDDVGHGYAFSNGMFDLEARVDLQKVILLCRRIYQKLEGAECKVFDLVLHQY